TSVALLSAAAACAQIGGNGSDGAFTPSTNLSLDTTNNGGLFQFTAIAIPAGITVRVIGANPARVLCTGLVGIRGTLDVRAGGYAGGIAFRGPINYATDGQGPGGGRAAFTAGNGGHAAHATSSPNSGIPTYGSNFPFDLQGGSGGGGAWSFSISFDPTPGT